MSQFTAQGYTDDVRLASLKLDEMKLPRAGAFDEYSPLSTIPETIGNAPFPGVELPAQNATTDLLFLRAQFPFLPIIQFPDRVISLYLAQNVPQSLPVPDGSVIGRFKGTGNYYISRRGNADIPSATTANPNMSPGDIYAASLFKPEDSYFYIGGVREFSAITPDANCIVQLAIYKVENWPRR